jgi:hypothetical protein
VCRNGEEIINGIVKLSITIGNVVVIGDNDERLSMPFEQNEYDIKIM